MQRPAAHDFYINLDPDSASPAVRVLENEKTRAMVNRMFPGRYTVYPGPILLDLKTADYFWYAAMLPTGDAAAYARYTTNSHIRVGTYMTEGPDKNASIIAVNTGLRTDLIEAAKTILGEPVVDAIVKRLAEKNYYSDSIRARFAPEKLPATASWMNFRPG
jgi:hypothetical protein